MSLPSALAADASSGRLGFSREFDLLCAYARVRLGREGLASPASSNEAAIDPAEFLRLAEHHGVLPLVARNLLDRERCMLPSDFVHLLRTSFEENVRRSLWFASELVRIADHFQLRGLRAVPYKGPVLAESAYGDVALRRFSDLDLLIAPVEFGRAKEALGELGYRPSAQMSPAVERYWLREGYERSFDSTAGKYLVELQWRVLPRLYAVDLRTEELLARCGRTSLGGRDVACLSPEDSLLVLCLHAAKHLWMRLIWVCDIAETVRTQAVDWRLFLSRARDLGILRIVGVSFWLVRRLLDFELPPTAQEFADEDSEVPALGELLATRLARSAVYDFESTEYFRWIWRLRERRGDRLRYLWRLVWTPGAGDLNAVRLPEALIPLYRGVRLARLAMKVPSLAGLASSP
jgi:hypothetical protein